MTQKYGEEGELSRPEERKIVNGCYFGQKIALGLLNNRPLS
jgi:hypothetical protein